MAETEQRQSPPPSGKGYLCTLLAVWTAVAAASLLWNLDQQRREVVDSARLQAQTAYEKDLVYRRWLSAHGGVYVPVTDRTQPNPYLQDVPNRDVGTPAGRLTLVNPAAVTRQVHEMEAETTGVRSRVSSLRPINPRNAADPWETGALREFERGVDEVVSVQRVDGKARMRLMRPLMVEEACLECHANQGYRVGDVRGGISVSVPMQPLWAPAKMHMLTLSVGHGFLWLVGLAGIGLGMRKIRRQQHKRFCAEQTLKENEIRMRTIAAHNARLRAEKAVTATENKLRIARRIQERFLPTEAPAVDGFDIGGVSYPAEATSGDYYDYIPMQDGSVGIVIADVTGHGFGPALFAAETSAYLRALAETVGDVGEILTRLNLFLAAEAGNDFLVTLFFARLDPRSRSLTFVSAGHPTYLVGVSGEVKTLHATGLPLGVMPGAVYPASEPIPLQRGDAVLLVTDGIPEASNGNGSRFGVEGAVDVVRANGRRPAREIAQALCRAAREFSNGHPLKDDITAVVAKVE